MTWICNFKDYDLPVLAETKEEAIAILEKWNNDGMEGDGEISEPTVETYTFESGTREITTIYLTCESFDKDDPYGTAYLYDYGDFIKNLPSPDDDDDDTEVLENGVKIKNCMSPLFGEDQIYDNPFYALRLRTIGSVLSVAVLKEVPTKDVRIATQTNIFDWLDSNIPVEIQDFTTQSDPEINAIALMVFINKRSNDIAQHTRRGPATSVVVGSRIALEIKGILKKEPNRDVTLYTNDDYTLIGYHGGIPFYVSNVVDIPEDMVYMSYSNAALDKGAFLLKDGSDYYLNVIKPKENYPLDYKDYYRTIRINRT